MKRVLPILSSGRSPGLVNQSGRSPAPRGDATENAPLTDRFERPIESLRVSVTDRCNFRCFYCIDDEDMQWMPRAHLLSLEELARVVRVAVSAGVRKVRFTGGEPLLRRNLPRLVEMVAALDVEDLALTTNGVLLERFAPSLANAGLKRVNVSLDSLDAATFRRITRRDALASVLRGIEAARRAGLDPIRVNCVAIRGVNDHEALDFAHLARKTGVEVRFIEFMPLEHGTRWGDDALVPGHELRGRIEAAFPLTPKLGGDPHAASRDWVFADGAPGAVGFIDSVTRPFCRRCNRIRLTADGMLRTCLFSLHEHDFKTPLRAGESDAQLFERLQRAVATKEKKHHVTDGLFVKPERTMSQIGG